MAILFTGRKAHLTPDLKEFTESKLGKLDRVLEDISDVHVILKLEKHRHLAEIVVKSRSATLTAKADATEFHDSIGLCVERLLAQAKRHQGRLTTRRRGRGAWTGPQRAVPAAEAAEGAEIISGDGGAALVRMGRVALRPMSLEEALQRARDSRHPLVVFRDADSSQVSVIFKRPDGQFGLVETEA